MHKNHLKNIDGEREVVAASMKRSEFSDEVESARRDAESLRDRISASTSQKDDLLLQAVEQLQTTVEELQVAEEELHAQNDELLAAREALLAERTRYQELFEFAPDGYLVTNANGKILEANRAAAGMLGVKRRLLVEKLVVSFVVEEQRTSFRNALNGLCKLTSDEVRKLEFSIQPRGGQVFYASLHASPKRERAGEGLMLRWLMRDITFRKKAEEQIRTMNAELEERVRQRTAELEQVSALKDELLIREQRAREEAEAANRSKDEFFAIVSHELRTPLNTILGWAQMLRSNMKDEALGARAAEVIERSAHAQSQIINDILDVTRSVTGKLRLDKAPLDLGAVVKAAVEDSRPAAEAKGISLDVTLDRTVGPAIGDHARLQQVVGNLLSNSIKFTPANGRIEVSLNRADDYAEITVSDNGNGISPDFLPRVFDRFRQADSTLTRRQSGLGLGLAIVRLLVEMHNGTVHAASEGEGKGSAFTVKLPLAIENASAPALAAAEDVPHADTLQGLWVLVVDDDCGAQEMMRAALEGAGARVTTCGTCAETISLFSSKSTASLTPSLPDVLVADIAMPGQDGFDLIRGLRMLAPKRGGTIPAIALTAYASEEARAQALANGFQTYITKPIHLGELVAAIARLANRAS